MELFEAKTATVEELKALRRELMLSPLKTADGNVFQFSEDDQLTMAGALPSLQVDGGSIPWRLLDNSTVMVDYATLNGYYEELKLLYSRRGMQVDTKYIVLKDKDVLLNRDLVDWKKQIAADWWE